MSKSRRTKLTGLVAAAPSHNHATTHLRDDVPTQLHDDDVPAALPEPQKPETSAPQPAPRSARVKGKQAAETELKDYAHRSLYAKPETLELIRQIAFNKRVSAQHLYREGLLLMLQEHGHYEDKTIDDV